jgi:hypothetical protein
MQFSVSRPLFLLLLIYRLTCNLVFESYNSRVFKIKTIFHISGAMDFAYHKERGSVVVKALCYKPERRGLDTR